MYLHVEEEIPELVFIPFDLPLYIFAVNKDELGIYGHEGLNIYRLFVYSPEENTLQETSVSHSSAKTVAPRLFQYYEDGVFMVRDYNNIYYLSQDGTEHGLLGLNGFSGVSSFNKRIVYANGYLFYQNSNYMERVKIKAWMEEILQSE